ncbi:MAG: DUF3592 domain-containing protein [Candidatus Omnitrophica bacterium]|nr:DUF3592 domain-containing protein [Candidatus Omnitrophota bacterium]
MRKRDPQAISRGSAAEPARAGIKNRLVPALFLGVFMIAGGSIFYVLCARPAFRILQARQWPEVSCEIISSKVAEHQSDDGRTYSVDIFYRYWIDGEEFKSTRACFFDGYSSGYQPKAAVVARYPAGTMQVCYFNPHNPAEAVLMRDFYPEMFMIGGFGLLFFCVGFFPILSILFGKNRQGAAVPERHGENFPYVQHAGAARVRWHAGIPILRSDAPPADDGVVLKPLAPAVVKFALVAIFTLIWNAAIFFGAGNDVVRLFQGPFTGINLLFKIFTAPILIFFAIGLFLIGVSVYLLLAMLNPTPVLTLNSDVLSPGGLLKLTWRLQGRAERVARLRILLEGREVAKYRRGTNTVTDTKVFVRVPLVEEQDPASIAGGAREAEIPELIMHSFESAHNKIIWALKVEGEIRRWPDIKEEFSIIILPRSGGIDRQ